MTKVLCAQLPTNSRSNATTESTTDSSAGVFIPRSDSSPSFTFEPAEEITSHLQGRSGTNIPAGSSADQVRPSIERSSDNSSDTDDITNTPPPSTKKKGKAVQCEGNESDSIDGLLENMRMSSPRLQLDTSDVTAAIAGLAIRPGNQAMLLGPTNPNAEGSSSNLRSSRRRSSSRVNITPYNLQDEEPPQDRFHEPAFQQAFSDAKGLMSELADVLGSSAVHIDPDSTMKRLHTEAGDLAHFQCPSTRTVGFVGDSGVGSLNHHQGRRPS